MAEVTAFRNNALPYPVYAVPWAVVFPMLDADGDLVTGATTPDAEVSLNGNTFADCTNESVEIATTSGVYYLLLTAAEMTADIVTVIAKSATAGMKTTTLTFYPRKLVPLRSGTAQGGAAGSITLDASAGARDDRWNGCLCVATIDTLVECRVINDYTGSTQVAAVTPNWNVTPDSDDTFVIYLPEGMQLPTVNVGHVNETAQTARDIGASVLLSTGTGTGQLDFTSGVVKANLAQILGTALTETAGQIAAAFKKFFDKATPTGTINSIPDAVAGAANGLFIAGTNAATAITTALTANITGNLSGSVGSVTGAVGSVTGAVGSVAAGGITAASVATGAIDADALASDAVTEIRSVVSGTSDSGTTTTMVDAARTEADTDYWAGDIILFTSGNISGQARVITAFDPATDTITFTPATTQAVATQTYEIIPGARAVLAGITHISARIPNVTLTDTITTYTGNTPQTGDAYPKVDTEIATIITDVAAVKADTAAILVDTGTTLDGRIPSVLVGGRIDASVGAMAAGVVTAAAVATNAIDADALAADAVAELADGVWDEAIAGHLGAGSTGLALNSAGAAGDPWSTALPGAYGAGTAGKIVGDNVNAPIATVDTVVDAIKAKTDNLPTDPADESLIEAAITAATSALALQTSVDDLEGRLTAARAGYLDNLSAGAVALASGVALTAGERTTLYTGILRTALTEAYNADGSPPSVEQALFVIMQALTEFAIVGTTLTVKKLDGTTTAFTETLDSATTPSSTTRAT